MHQQLVGKKEEMYSLTDQIRRSSRSVPANIAEAYRKRVYPKHFHSKLTDSDGENSETQVWLEFSLKCNYINQAQYNSLIIESEEVGKLINYMIVFGKVYQVCQAFYIKPFVQRVNPFFYSITNANQ